MVRLQINKRIAEYFLTELASREFDEWLEDVSPTWHWEWKHLVLIREQLARITAGELKKLMILMPPRHGKSEQVTVRYPIFRLEQDPLFRVIIAAYNQDFANTFSRFGRKIARERIELNPEHEAVHDWETIAGGGLRAAGVGGGVTGKGANLIIIDDPIKNSEEAHSEIYRNKVWEWYTKDIYTRLEPGGAIILIMTHWDEDDIAARILESEDGPNWEILRLPAECETQEERDEFAGKYGLPVGEPDPLGREVGEALCPERYPLPALREIYKVVQSYGYAALYQQRPTPYSGGMIKVDKMTYLNAMPRLHDGKIRYWDKAGTEGGGAYSAGVLLVRLKNGLYIIENVRRGQWSAFQREEIIKATAEQDERHVTIYVEQEPADAGKESAAATIRMLVGYNVRADRPTGDKVVRALSYAAQVEAGNIMLLTGSWNADFIEENRQFPFGKYKDQVDAVVGAFNMFNVPRAKARALGKGIKK